MSYTIIFIHILNIHLLLTAAYFSNSAVGNTLVYNKLDIEQEVLRHSKKNQFPMIIITFFVYFDE